MKQRRFARSISVAILALMLASCSVVEMMTAMLGDGGDRVSLSQGYDNEGLSFNYPDGWVAVDDMGQIMIASSQETLDLMMGEDSAGPPLSQLGMAIILMPLEELGLGDDATPMSVMEMFLPMLQSEGEMEFSELSEETIAGKTAVHAEASDENMQVAIIIVDVGGGAFALVTGAAAPGELNDFNDEINTIIGSMNYSAP